MFDKVDAHALAPDFQLLHSAGAIGVAGGEQDALALIAVPLGELGDGGGLAHAVDAGHEPHGGPVVVPANLCVPVAQGFLDVILEKCHGPLSGVKIAVVKGRGHLISHTFGRARADICRNQRLDEFLDGVLVELAPEAEY